MLLVLYRRVHAKSTFYKKEDVLWGFLQELRSDNDPGDNNSSKCKYYEAVSLQFFSHIID